MAPKGPQLKEFRVPNFLGGYNSYTASKSNLKDNEIPIGQNAELDDNGSVSKVFGKQAYGAQVNSGNSITGMGVLKNSTYNRLVVSSGSQWFYNNGTTCTAITGLTFTAGLDTDFAQAVDRLYGANGTDALSYTSDAVSATAQTSNGNIGRWPVAFNQRLYMTNTANKDRIYYSNPYAYDTSTASYSLSNFGTFNTDLTATPKKNAGFIILMPGAGVEITRLIGVGNSLYAYTKFHGIWKIDAVSTANADGSIAHTISQIVTYGGTPAGRSVIVNSNDQWFYGGDGEYSYGEVAYYQNPRRSTKSGRIRSELASISNDGKSSVASVVYNDKVYIAYRNGTYNDRMVKYDNRLNAYSTPIIGINASCFIEYEDSSGVRRLLAGSSDSTDSYVYSLDSGTNFNGSAISSFFETKSFDCGSPGLIKRFGFIDVFYSLLSGVVTYEVFLDQVSSVTGSVQIGTSATGTVGVGSQAVGLFAVGNEFTSTATAASISTNGQFRVDCEFNAGSQVSVRITNNNLAEQYKIDSASIYYLPGSIYEQ
jgi:hypothetical protein